MSIFNIILLLISLILFLFLLKKNLFYISLNRINIVTFPLYLNFIIFSYVGMMLIAFGYNKHYMLIQVKNLNNFNLGIYYYCLMLILFGIGMTIASGVFKFNSKFEVPNFINKDVTLFYSKLDKAVLLTTILFTIISLFVILYTFISVRTFPLFEILLGNSDVMADRLRIQVSREFGGLTMIRNLFGIVLTPLISYIAFAYFLKTNNLQWRILFYILLVLSVIIVTYDLSKAPLLIYIFGLLIIYSITLGKINIGRLLKYGGLIFTLIIFMYAVIYNVSDFFNVYTGPLGRIFYGQISALFLTLETFPRNFNYLMGDSFPSILGGTDLRSSQLIMEVYNRSAVEKGTAGVMNTLFIGEAYANYGTLGIVLSSLYIGFLMQTIFIIFTRIKKTPLNIAFFTFFTIRLPLTGGFVDFIYNPLVLFLVFLYFVFVLLNNINNKKFILRRDI